MLSRTGPPLAMKEASLTGVATAVSEADAENGNTAAPPPNDTSDTYIDNVPGEHVDNAPDGHVDNAPDGHVDNTPDAHVDNAPEEETAPPARSYVYKEGQWAPHNPQGAKRYDREFLLQLQDDPQSKIKPNDIPSSVVKFDRPEGFFSLSSIARPNNSESFLPTFAKTMSPKRGPNQREMKKSNSMVSKPMMRSGGGPGGMGGPGPNKNMIRVSLSLREDVKLNESENAWKPRVKKELTNSQFMDEDQETQDLYKKFRGILNKLTPQKFDKLIDQVKNLNINTQARLKGVIDLVFEKAIDEPAFSEAYAAMCQRLSQLMVPSDNANDQYVNFRVLLINRCQAQFETTKVHEEVMKLEKELEECTDPAKKKELMLMLDEENRKIRMRSVGNIRFIGELYKLKMLIPKIMVYCMNHLIDKLEEEKLECLCKLLNTIGQQVESEAKAQVDLVFKKMQDIVDQSRKGQVKISSRVRFMLQDTIELKKKKWVAKNVIGAGPKTMDQIQKEAEQQHREIELMNSGPMGGDRRGGGGRDSRDGRDRRDDRRGDGRRGGSNNYSDWPQNTQTKTKFVVDTSKFKAGASNSNKNLSNVKLGPPPTLWNYGSGAKPAQPVAPAPMTNMFSVLETGTDPVAPQLPKDRVAYQPKGSSMEKPPIRAELSGARSASVEGPRPISIKPVEPAPQAPTPLSDNERKLVQSTFEQALVSPNDEELVLEIKEKFKPSQHAGVIAEMFNITLEKPTKFYAQICKSLLHLVSSKTISPENFLAGLEEIMEFAPDLHIDIPKVYDYLAFFSAPHIVSKHITLQQLLKPCAKAIAEQQGHMFLGAIVKELKTAMGPSFARAIWLESRLTLSDWMSEEQANKFKEDENFKLLEGTATIAEESTKKLTPQETQHKLLQLMVTEQSADCIRGWVHDNVGKASSEDWFMRIFIQAICEFALFGPGERTTPRFNQDRMSKYIQLINDFGEDRSARELNCLLGIQQLVHRLEHPRGVTLEIFQYLSDNYVIQREAFLAFETCELEPEGKAVMLKALVSFYTDIKEADNEDSGSEE